MTISVPAELDGFKVKALPCKIRTQEFQGDILSPGDLLLELESAVRPFNGKEETSLLDGAGDHSFFFSGELRSYMRSVSLRFT